MPPHPRVFLPPLRPWRPAAVGLALTWCLAVGLGASAPAHAAGPNGDEITAELVAKRQKDLERGTNLEEATRSAAQGLYAEAAQFITTADQATARAQEFERVTKEAPTLLDTIRAELAQPPTSPEVSVTAETPLQEIEQALAEAEAALAAARTQAEDIQAEPKRRADRRATLTTDIARLRQRLAELEEVTQTAAPVNEPPALALARTTRLEAEHRAVAQELLAAEREVASYDARANLLPARTDRALRRVQQAELRLTGWQTVAQDRRRLEAETAHRETKRLAREVMTQYPMLQPVVQENTDLAEERTGEKGLTRQLETLTGTLTDTRTRLAALRDQERATRRKVAAAGLTQAMGLVLRRQYDALPDEAALRRQRRLWAKRSSDAQFKLIVLEERRAEVGDVERELQALLAAAPAGVETADLETAARELLTQRRDLLDALVNEYGLYFDRGLELGAAIGALADTTAAYRDYIAERILWVRSAQPLHLLQLSPLRDAFQWLLHPGQWLAAIRLALEELRTTWPTMVAAVLALAVLVGVRPALRRTLSRRADEVAEFQTDAYRLTVESVALTVLLAAPLPLALWYAGWWLGAPSSPPTVAVAMTRAVRPVAVVWFALALLAQAVRPHGLVEAHFRWPMEGLRYVRRRLRWAAPIILVCTTLVLIFERQEVQEWKDGIGRLALIVALGVVAAVDWRIFRPGSAVLTDFRRVAREGWLRGLQPWLRRLLVGIPAALIIMTVLGYAYTVQQFAWRLSETLLLMAVLAVVHALLLRWLYVARRKLFAEQARKRATEREEKGEAATVVEQAVDVFSLDAQTRRLFRSLTTIALVLGLYVLWIDMMPALRMLNRVQVWPSFAVMPATEEALVPPIPLAASAEPTAIAPAAPSPAPTNGAPLPGTPVAPAAADETPEDLPQVVTLADVGFALIVLAVTVIGARNVPGLLEIIVFQHLAWDAGGRHAVSTIVRYFIVIVGLTAAFGAVGIGWSTVQWLAAALTFGLAFGLQEIFANFVSGLIILLERPMRIGDTVTVGGITGTVTQMRMRATTILDWDNKELIVPNKSFITGELINWTLSDSVMRVIVPVGVAYGSDVSLTEQTLLRVAHECPMVLDDPAPVALFLGFGDSALLFELRVYIATMKDWNPVRHALHKAVDAAFRKADIEISFPQRDVHIRYSDAPIEIVRRPAPTEAGAEPPG